MKMQAITRTKYGSPEILTIEEISRPKPKAKQIAIRVHYTTVNRTDCGILIGKPFLIRAFTGLTKPSSLVPGTDFSGEVIEIGDDVSNFNVGDRVWGLNDEGLESHAEYMVIKENKAVLKIPEGISFQHAVASAEGAHYAFNFLNKIKLKNGDKVLVNGATGAIGSAMVQMLIHYGAKVTAVANTKNMELINSLGVEKCWNYETEDFTTDEENYDYICDAVGKSRFAACKRIMKDKSIYTSSELGPRSENLYLPFLTFWKKKRVIFPIPSKPRRSLLFMNKLLENREFKPLIDRVYPKEQIKEAYEYVMIGEKTGNVLIDFIS